MTCPVSHSRLEAQTTQGFKAAGLSPPSTSDLGLISETSWVRLGSRKQLIRDWKVVGKSWQSLGGGWWQKAAPQGWR